MRHCPCQTMLGVRSCVHLMSLCTRPIARHRSLHTWWWRALFQRSPAHGTTLLADLSETRAGLLLGFQSSAPRGSFHGTFEVEQLRTMSPCGPHV